MRANDKGTEHNEADLEAFRWVVRLENGPLSPEQQRHFEAWRESSRKNQGAYIRAAAASLHFDRLSALAAGREASWPEPKPSINLTRRWWIAAASSAAFLGTAGVCFYLNRPKELAARYVSAVGELRRINLDDGSSLLLNTATEILVQYGLAAREVSLVRGEALFGVSGERRPFVVRAGEWILRSVVTSSFAIRCEPTETQVNVARGTVEALPAQTARRPRAKPRRLLAGEGASLHPDGVVQVRQRSNPEMERQLAWRTGLIIFDGEPLREAIAEMNRYSVRQFVVADPALAEHPIVGTFQTTDTETFVSMIEATLRVQAVEQGSVTLLRASR